MFQLAQGHMGQVSGQKFSPQKLFTNGTLGAWYDPSDPSTLFSDTDGTTPSPAPGAGALSVVGKMLDKSGNGNHAISYNTTTARPELSALVNMLTATATLATQSVTTQATNYTLYFTGPGSITLSGTATGTFNAGSNTLACTAGTLTLTVSGTVTTADLRPANIGAKLPAYQAVASAYSYDSIGFPRYLVFNGTSSGMYTPSSFNLSTTDKVAVFANARKTSDLTGIVAELSADVALNNGAFRLNSQPIGANNWRFSSKGTLLSNAAGSAYATPVTHVLTGIGDISGDVSRLRANGVVVITGVLDQGTGNFGSYPLYVGSRSNVNTWFTGYIYSLIVVGAASSTAQISLTEAWVNSKANGVY